MMTSVRFGDSLVSKKKPKCSFILIGILFKASLSKRWWT